MHFCKKLSLFKQVCIGVTSHTSVLSYHLVYIPINSPTHPSVDISLHKWKDSLPSGIYFLPESGYHIAEPEVALHNGTYLCVFKDVSGSKVKKLVIDLIITKKGIKKTQLPGIYINKIGSGSQRISVSVIYYVMFMLL